MIWQKTALGQDNNSNNQTKSSEAEFVNRIRLAKLCHSDDPVAAAPATIAVLAIERLDAGGKA